MANDEKLLNLPSVQSAAEFEAEVYPNWDAELDEAYAGIGPLAVHSAQVAADRELSPFQPQAKREAEEQEATKWKTYNPNKR